MRKLILLILRTVIPFRAVEGFNRLLRVLVAQGYRFQFFCEWRVMTSPPEWFDQHIDLCWKWHATHNPSSWNVAYSSFSPCDMVGSCNGS
jgi:hypothetical protein